MSPEFVLCMNSNNNTKKLNTTACFWLGNNKNVTKKWLVFKNDSQYALKSILFPLYRENTGEYGVGVAIA